MNLFLNVYQSSRIFFLFVYCVHLATGRSSNEPRPHATYILRMLESYSTSKLPRQEHLADRDARIRLCSKCRIINTYLNRGRLVCCFLGCLVVFVFLFKLTRASTTSTFEDDSLCTEQHFSAPHCVEVMSCRWFPQKTNSEMQAGNCLMEKETSSR